MFLDWRPDIEKTMHTLETVLSYYHAAKDVEAIVKEGYVNIYLWYGMLHFLETDIVEEKLKFWMRLS